MRAGFNYGLLFTSGALAILWIAVDTALWLSRRAERRAGGDELEVNQRLARAEAAIRRANQEIASAKAELAAHR